MRVKFKLNQMMKNFVFSLSSFDSTLQDKHWAGEMCWVTNTLSSPKTAKQKINNNTIIALVNIKYYTWKSPLFPRHLKISYKAGSRYKARFVAGHRISVYPKGCFLTSALSVVSMNLPSSIVNAWIWLAILPFSFCW